MIVNIKSASFTTVFDTTYTPTVGDLYKDETSNYWKIESVKAIEEPYNNYANCTSSEVQFLAINQVKSFPKTLHPHCITIQNIEPATGDPDVSFVGKITSCSLDVCYFTGFGEIYVNKIGKSWICKGIKTVNPDGEIKSIIRVSIGPSQLNLTSFNYNDKFEVEREVDVEFKAIPHVIPIQIIKSTLPILAKAKFNTPPFLPQQKIVNENE